MISISMRITGLSLSSRVRHELTRLEVTGSDSAISVNDGHIGET